jgi:hypothetical protein
MLATAMGLFTSMRIPRIGADPVGLQFAVTAAMAVLRYTQYNQRRKACNIQHLAPWLLGC